jgi:stearoyl-CoA desaturase (Delta-9 desaturase)
MKGVLLYHFPLLKTSQDNYMNDAVNKPPFSKINLSIFIGLPILALFAVPAWGLYEGYSGWAWMWAVVFLYLNGLSITGGYHRLWAHRAYKASAPLKLFYALWGAGALQNSILIWASDHRRHHRFVDDNEKDPYSAGRGLWFSHIGWMLREYAGNEKDFSNSQDLLSDPIVMWQDKHYVAITTAMNLGLPLLLGFIYGEVMGFLLLVGLLRLLVNHHVTFFINSLAHYWGKQPYTDENSARDNAFLAVLTYGEGYHNYHHIFQSDYRNGIRWYHWDPTKWMISACNWLGLAADLKRVPNFKIQRARVAMQLKRAQLKLDSNANAEPLRESLERELQLFADSLNRWKQLQSDRYERKVGELENALEEKKREIQEVWEQAQFRSCLKELEYSLKLQHKRINFLMAQMQPA